MSAIGNRQNTIAKPTAAISQASNFFIEMP
jgi:hypothetical protein